MTMMDLRLTVLSKNRVKLPKVLLESLCVAAGDQLAAIVNDNHIFAGAVSGEGVRHLQINMNSQITIPKPWRDELRISVGDIMECRLEGEVIELVPKTLWTTTAAKPDSEPRPDVDSSPFLDSPVQQWISRDNAARRSLQKFQ